MHRRDFIKASTAAAALLAAGGRAHGYAVSPAIRKFADTLPQFGAQIPVLSPNTTRYPGVDYYEIVAGATRQRLSSSLPAAGSRIYAYAADPGVGGTPNYRALGGAIAARRGRPVRIKYRSALPPQHIIPFDATLMTAPGMAGGSLDRIAVHLHGGLVPWASDGGPFHWISPGIQVGLSTVNWLADDTGLPTNDLYYPNNQTARFMWYHDHAIGTTRTSAYAGLASGYILTDTADDAVSAVYGGRTMILVFQDKVFYNPAVDPGYAARAAGATAGDLWYPYLYEKAIWKMQSSAKAAPVPSCVPEMFGDTMLVNSAAFPTVSVRRGAYRLRTLNACNARFLNLKFVYDAGHGEPAGGYLNPTLAPVNVYLIGTEGGFLPAPVQLLNAGRPLNPANPAPWLQAPAERSDVLVDFGACTGNVLLYNDAPAPFPMGAPIFDWYPGAPNNPNAAAIRAGWGPNTRTIMRFAVSGTGQGLSLPAIGAANPVLPSAADPVNGGLQLPPGQTVFTLNGRSFVLNPIQKQITLNETFDAFGRLEQRIGNNVAIRGQFGKTYFDPVSETVRYGTVEVWNLFNLTADVHPMHFHLFNAMVLRRRLFRNYNGTPTWAGRGRGPDPGEEGWKETIKMWPGECTTIAVLVEDPLPSRSVDVPQLGGGVKTSMLPVSPRTGGDEYVYHCHILEHEEHDMMRPLVALP